MSHLLVLLPVTKQFYYDASYRNHYLRNFLFNFYSFFQYRITDTFALDSWNIEIWFEQTIQESSGSLTTVIHIAIEVGI